MFCNTSNYSVQQRSRHHSKEANVPNQGMVTTQLRVKRSWRDAVPAWMNRYHNGEQKDSPSQGIPI